MGRTCGTNGGEMYVEFWWESLKKKKSCTRTRRRWQYNIRIGLKEVESEGEEWIVPA